MENEPSPIEINVRASREGFITPILGLVVHVLTIPSRYFDGREIWKEPLGDEPLRNGTLWTSETSADHARRVDTIVGRFFFVEIILLVLCCLGPIQFSSPSRLQPFVALAVRSLAYAVAIYRIATVTAYGIKMPLYSKAARTSGSVNSYRRIVVLGLVNYVELLVGYAIIYALNGDLLKAGATGSGLPISLQSGSVSDFIYFSSITQFTIGYGDIVPLGPLRLVVSLQAMSAIVLLVLLVSRYMGLVATPEEFAARLRAEEARKAEGKGGN